MKRIVAAVLSLITVLSLAACQPTPQQAIVAGKDSDRMLEEAQKSAADSTESSTRISLSRQYDIPKTYMYETTGADGLLNISVNAEVDVPEGGFMPIYRVKKTEFSQELVSAFFEALCGDAEMYEKAPPYSIDVEEVRTSGQMVGGRDMNGRYMSLDAYERSENGLNGEGRYLNVVNHERLVSHMNYSDYRNSAAGINFGSSASVSVLADTDVNENILSEIGLRPSEAKQMVQELLDETDSGMVVDSIYLQDDEQLGNYDDIVRPAERYAYMVYCVRSVENFTCSYVSGGTWPNGDINMENLAEYWSYETLYFLVNREGIFHMSWCSPIEVVEVVSEDAQLKPFSEIQEIFEKVMCFKYGAQLKSGDTEYDFIIDRVTLSLHRIIGQDSAESGLLVPAWNFYGKLIIASLDGDGTDTFEKLGESYFAINAIDGSVIDISV